MADKGFKNSLKRQMLKMTLIPLTLMTVAIVVVSVSIVRKSITDQIRQELIGDAELVGFTFDKFYNGDFHLVEGDDGEMSIYKGEQPLNGDDTLMAQLSDTLNINVSIFYNDTRLLTTLSDSSGNSAVGTKVAAVVKNEVLDTGSSAFYDNVMVYNTKSFAYYKPFAGADGSVMGMIGV
ncbi:MAG: cache domain-containing protein [Pseudobutyrivibrio sp.]|uniref:cache domain-containing protein n=1 Tax=Pseudobutyrivibrio sp. TaxID=2014367 RepID=UPI0025DDD4B7|nr:cache domain-containing protein [Pseudobutyrivibrio sp.]MBQ8490118.1 cache domain-containing protein [Pseudobutyrivibrio sp.]